MKRNRYPSDTADPFAVVAPMASQTGRCRTCNGARLVFWVNHNGDLREWCEDCDDDRPTRGDPVAMQALAEEYEREVATAPNTKRSTRRRQHGRDGARRCVRCRKRKSQKEFAYRNRSRVVLPSSVCLECEEELEEL